MATRKVRIKKLNVKLPLEIITEEDLGESDYHALTQELQLATGVDAAEEGVRTLESRAIHVTPLLLITFPSSHTALQCSLAVQPCIDSLAASSVSCSCSLKLD